MDRESVLPWLAVALGGAAVGLLGALSFRALYVLWRIVESGFSRSPAAAVTFPLLGLLASYLLVDTFAVNKSIGSATGIVLAEYHTKGAPSLRDSVVRTFAGVATIGFGGAAGPEGPGILIGPGIMQYIARILGIRSRRGRLTLAGAAAGLAGVLKTPATAILYALEVPFTRGIEKEPFLEVVLAATASYAVSVALTGPVPLFAVQVQLISGPATLVWSAILGVVAGAYSIGFSKLYGLAGRASSTMRLRGGFALTVLTGGAAVGLLGLASRSSIGPGIDLMGSVVLGALAIQSLALLLALRSFTVTATLNFGGVGGLLTPVVINGALLGALYAKLLGLEPISFYALVGAAATLAGTYKILLAPAAMVVELSGVGFMIPALLASAVSYAVSLPTTLFRFQLTGSAKEEALLRSIYSKLKGSQFLSHLRVSDVVNRAVRSVKLDDPLRVAIEVMTSEGLDELPVVDEGGRLVGRISIDDISWLGESRLDAPVSSAPLLSANSIGLDAPLDDAIERMLTAGIRTFYAVAPDGVLVGVLDEMAIVRALMGHI
ncbi:chloride channel protein [Conexivisphaera calida]|uniref:chloride channel protein n=1 Tax=Conexivisphaera calida TaxID=1874277 RepID=UPI00157A3082|nr:chloride channel protein [Conexivisphaera calida]